MNDTFNQLSKKTAEGPGGSNFKRVFAKLQATWIQVRADVRISAPTITTSSVADPGDIKMAQAKRALVACAAQIIAEN